MNIAERSDALHSACMLLVRADLADADLTSLSDVASYRFVNRVMHAASIELTAALTSPPEMPFYFSDSIYDEISSPTETIHLCANVIGALFNADELNDEIIDAFAELFDAIALDIDDLIDDNEHLPSSMNELIELYN